MTKPSRRDARAGRCDWCGRPFEVDRSVLGGRPPKYCRRSCRQRMYEARRRADELGLGERELVVTRRQLELLTDQLYVLAETIGDVRRSLDGVSTVDDATELLQTVLDAAAPLLRDP